MNFINNFLSVSEILKLMDKDGYIEVILPIPFGCILNYDKTFFLNYISYNILGNHYLLDISYKLVGLLDDNLLFNIKGNISIFLEVYAKDGIDVYNL